MRRVHSIGTLVVLSAVLIASRPWPVRAERLAVRRYTTADGLAGDYILGVRRDSRGFLWFSTRDGLSRFDGVRFTSYGMADGLSSSTINQFVELRDGSYWVATNGGGVCRFNPFGQRPRRTEHGGTDRGTTPPPAPATEPMFTPFRVGDTPASSRVNVIFEDRASRLWLGTDGGLFRLDRVGGRETFHFVELPVTPSDPQVPTIAEILEDADGSLWIGGGRGLTRLLPDGRGVRYIPKPSTGRDGVLMLRVDERQRLWAGFRSGLLVLDIAPASSFGAAPSPIVRIVERAPASDVGESAAAQVERNRWFTTAQGLPDDIVSAAHFGADGRVWVGTGRGLSLFDGERFHAFTESQGLPVSHVTDIVPDSAGNIWIGSVTGATKLVRDGLVTYGAADGLPAGSINVVGQDAQGRLYTVGSKFDVSVMMADRFTTARPAIPASTCAWLSRCGIIDRAGDWWLVTQNGLFRWTSSPRLSDLETRPPLRIGSGGQTPEDAPFSVFEDAANNLWISTTRGHLSSWNRATGAMRDYGERDGLPPLRDLGSRVVAYAEDRAGQVWMGLDIGGVVRLRNGRFDHFAPEGWAPFNSISSLLVDATGRLWIGSTQAGLIRSDNPSADRPAFVALTTSDGLASNNVRSLVDDVRGRIYAGTSRGISRVDPVSGAVTQFSVAEGLASAFVMSAVRDREGALWFGTLDGLSRLAPDRADPGATTRALAGPVVFIDSVRVAGVAEAVSDLGERVPAALTLASDRNQLEIGFFGISFDAGEPLRYQYQLEGTEKTWSAPTDLRAVNYARLSAGSYRFLVRAVRSDGKTSETPASLAFTVLPPIYARWWFLTLGGLLAAGLVFEFYRIRVAQIIRLGRVRTRIATDLHDDIGASLSQISILAEVTRARMKSERLDPAAAEPLTRIAETSRELVDAMSDIVWAINPEVDTLGDLVHRMRRFVEDTLSASDIDVVFRGPLSDSDLKLGADVRREIFLILKESVTNIAKHSGARHAAIDFESDRRVLRLKISDDGRGFDPALTTDGNGVASMRRRVAALGGTLDIDSAPGRGTTIRLVIERR